MANINKIRISGTSYDIQDSNATKVVDITQAEYDVLPASAKTANILYNITDAEAVDFSQYWTSAETQSAITEATSGKVSTSDFNTYSGSVDTALNSKASQTDLNTLSGTVTSHTASTTIHVTAQDKTNWNNKSDFSGSYNDLTDKPTIPTVPTNVSDFTNDAGYITSSALDGYATTATTSAINNTLTGHTADTTIHVSAEQIAAWNAKSDFSGSYDDLTDKPTIPTSASQLTNDTGYITSSALNGYATTGDVQTATNDMATKTWVGQQGYLTQHQDISGKQDVSGMTAYTETTAFTAHTADTTVHVTSAEKASWNAKSDFSGSYNDLTNKLSAGTNITIVDNVISAEGGGGKAVSAGTNISITTGETADTINCTLPITASTSIRKNDITIGNDIVNGTSDYRRLTIGNGNKYQYSSSRTSDSILIATPGNSSSIYNIVKASSCIGIGGRGLEVGYDDVSGYGSIAIGYGSKSIINKSLAIGHNTVASGTTQTNINNQLTIDTSNQVYIYNKDNTEMICLQDQLGGGGSSYSAGTGIDITNDVISVTGMTAESAFTAHTASTVHMTATEKTNLDSLATNIAAISGITSTKVGNWDTASTNSHTHSNKTVLDGINSTKVSNWDGAATNASNAVTALGGLSLVKLTQAQYDALATKDNSTLYVIVN